jgi:hypothetical protein
MTICFADLADWTPTGKLKLGCPSCSTLVLPGERALALAVFERSKLPRIRFLGATSRCECILVAVASIQRQGPYMRVPGPAYPGLPSGFQHLVSFTDSLACYERRCPAIDIHWTFLVRCLDPCSGVPALSRPGLPRSPAFCFFRRRICLSRYHVARRMRCIPLHGPSVRLHACLSPVCLIRALCWPPWRCLPCP